VIERFVPLRAYYSAVRRLIEAELGRAKAKAMNRWLVCFLALALAVPAQAEYVSGAELLDRCLTPRSSAEATCLGYVAGVADSVIAYEAEADPLLKRVCIPTTAMPAQFLDVVRKYLVANPEQYSWTAQMLVFNALLKAFPCP